MTRSVSFNIDSEESYSGFHYFLQKYLTTQFKDGYAKAINESSEKFLESILGSVAEEFKDKYRKNSSHLVNRLMEETYKQYGSQEMHNIHNMLSESIKENKSLKQNIKNMVNILDRLNVSGEGIYMSNFYEIVNELKEQTSDYD